MKIVNNKAIKLTLSISLIIASIGNLILRLASGHHINTKDFEDIKLIGVITFFFLSGVLLFFFNRNSSSFIRYLNILFLSLSVISLLYILYELTKIKLDLFSALFPILFLIIILFLSVVMLVNIVRINKRY